MFTCLSGKLLCDMDYLTGFNNKEQASWKLFYKDYYVSICAYVNKFIKEPEVVEDIVQETFIKIWKSSRQFPNMQELTWYLYKAAYMNSMDYLRTEKLHQKLLKDFEQEDFEMPEEHFTMTVQEELIRRLYAAVRELPQEAQKILFLTLDGLSGTEIAEQLHIIINTVKSHKKRSLKILREKLQRPYYWLFFYIIYSSL